VLRPSLLRSPSRAAVGRNLALDVIVAVGIGVTMSLVGAILPTVGRLGGLDPVGLSALAAAPFVANVLGAFAGRVGPRSVAQLSLMRGIGAASLLALFVVPSALTAVVVSVVFWVSYALSGPYHFRLWGAMYPSRSLGRVMGVLGMTRAGAGAVAAIGGGILADRIGGSQAVALVGAIGVACALAYAGFRATADTSTTRFSARESVRALLDQPHLVRLVVAQIFYGGGLIAASPLFALVYVDRLHLSIADVGLVGVLTAVANTLTYPLWGAFADRRGGSRTLAVGSAIGAASVVAYALAPNVAVLWIGAIAGGIASGAIDLGINAAVSTETPMATRAAAMAGWNAITGPRGIVAAFLMSILIQLHLVDVTGALLLSAGTALVGMAIYARSGPGGVATSGPVRREPAAAAARASA
jgi:NNP family nitrate/nitrite transporter-like MFS transporter